METAVSSPFLKLNEGKETDDHRSRYVGRARSQDKTGVGWVDDASNGSVKSSDRTESEAGGYSGRAHPMASSPPTAVVAAVVVVAFYSLLETMNSLC